MNKLSSIEAINRARDSHISQMKKIELLIGGEEIENPTSVKHTECVFGKWFYNKDNQVEEILGSLFYEKMEILHTKWHGEYARVFEIFFTNRKTGFFSKILGTDKIDEMDMDKAKLYYRELQATTELLLHAISSSQRRISALSDSKFK